MIPTAPLQKLRKLQALKVAHDRGFHTLDYVPDADSPLNTLLAFRRVQAVITQTNASIQDVEARIRSAQTLLKSSTAAGSEQDRLKAALGARLATLEDAERQIDVGASIGSQGDLVRKMRAKRKEVMRRTARLLGELLYFLDAGLARMVAAEQMGGPVVGDDVDVTLATGFDKKGNVKKGNRRIDEMWGQGDEDPEKRMVLEFKDLLEVSQSVQLLPSLSPGYLLTLPPQELMSASLENSPYIELKKDSAAARFLVRAKVAVFHPKDAQRMKLVDFGSNVEDG